MRAFPILILACFALEACTTSKDLAEKGVVPARPMAPRKRSAPTDYEDPTGVKTISEAPESARPTQSPQTVEALQQELAVVRGELEDARVQSRSQDERMQARVKELERERAELIAELEKLRTQSPQPVAGAGGAAGSEAAVRKGADALWELAKADLKGGRIEATLASFDELVRSYPKDARHPYALIGSGFASYRLKQYKAAAVTFNQFIDRYPRHAGASLAWFGGGAALSQMGQAEDAKLFFDEVVKRFPNSAEAREARLVLSRKRKAPGDLFVAFPNWLRGT